MIDGINDWELLRFLAAVGRAGSFSGAAELLSASHPTIGRKIDQLEAKVGAKLLVRTSSGVYLTEVGQRIFRIAEEMQALVRSIPDQADHEAQLSGVIHCAGSDGIVGYWLPYMLKDFFQSHPNITLKIECTDMRAMPDLSKREADLAVLYREPTNPDVIALVRGEVQVGFCASQNYLAKHPMPKTWDEVLEHPLLAHETYYRHDGPWPPLAAMLAKHKQVVIRSNSFQAMAWPLTHDVGISVMPKSCEAREAWVFWDIEGWESPKVQFWLCCHKAVRDLPAARVLIDYLKGPFRRWANGVDVRGNRSDHGISDD